ncbi:MAG: type IV secretory system conjugative DNA transfer family protein, partial [Aggregatilineales bacterium]
MKTGTEILLGRPIHYGESFNEFSSYRQSPGANGYKKFQGRERNSIGVTTGNFPIHYTGDSHLVTIAPTGAGKGRCAIIPNLLRYRGPVVVVDPKGENYAVTARTRREMGQKV